MQKTLAKITAAIDRVESVIAVYMLGAIVLIMGTQVVMRYVFHNPLTWAQELSILMMIYMSFFAADMVYRRKAHIGIDFFINLFPPRVRKLLNLLVYILILIFLAVVFRASLTALRLQAGHDFAGVLPLSKSFWILPVSLTFPSMVISTLLFLVQAASGKRIRPRRTLSNPSCW